MTDAKTTAAKPTTSEVLEQFTGYDEQAVVERFGEEVLGLAGSKFLRALVFGDTLHQGKTADEAYAVAMQQTIKQVRDHFSEEADAMPDEPDTASGKGASADDA